MPRSIIALFLATTVFHSAQAPPQNPAVLPPIPQWTQEQLVAEALAFDRMLKEKEYTVYEIVVPTELDFDPILKLIKSLEFYDSGKNYTLDGVRVYYRWGLRLSLLKSSLPLAEWKKWEQLFRMFVLSRDPTAVSI